jgi:hypothetical protein
MRPLTSLTLEAMVDLVSQSFAPIPDPRAPDRVDYSLHDTLMSGVVYLCAADNSTGSRIQ